MRIPLYKKYANSPAVGAFSMCNFGGVEILELNNDYVIACFNFGTGRQQIRKHKIYTSDSWREYIRKQGTRYYLDQMMRV